MDTNNIYLTELRSKLAGVKGLKDPPAPKAPKLQGPDIAIDKPKDVGTEDTNELMQKYVVDYKVPAFEGLKGLKQGSMNRYVTENQIPSIKAMLEKQASMEKDAIGMLTPAALAWGGLLGLTPIAIGAAGALSPLLAAGWARGKWNQGRLGRYLSGGAAHPELQKSMQNLLSRTGGFTDPSTMAKAMELDPVMSKYLSGASKGSLLHRIGGRFGMNIGRAGMDSGLVKLRTLNKLNDMSAVNKATAGAAGGAAGSAAGSTAGQTSGLWKSMKGNPWALLAAGFLGSQLLGGGGLLGGGSRPQSMPMMTMPMMMPGGYR